MTLSKEIEDFQKEMIPQIPEDVLQVIMRTSAELIGKKPEGKALREGDTIPGFTLPDATGNQVASKELLKNGPMVISFYRGGWCPYCNLELKALQTVLPEIKSLNASLVTISPELPDYSLTTQEKNALEFPVLSDQKNKVAGNFGLVFELNKELLPLYKTNFDWDLMEMNGTENVELPFPATYVVDKAGIIQYAFVDADYTRRAEPKKIIEVLKAIASGV